MTTSRLASLLRRETLYPGERVQTSLHVAFTRDVVGVKLCSRGVLACVFAKQDALRAAHDVDAFAMKFLPLLRLQAYRIRTRGPKNALPS